MQRRLPSIPVIEAHGAFAQQIWAIVAWILGPTAIGAGFAMLAWISDVLSEYAPFSWAAIGLISAFVASAALALYGLWIERRARSRFYRDITKQPSTVNPLEQTFEGMQIAIQDFDIVWPEPWESKSFIDCLIIGSAIVAVNGGSLHHCGFGASNMWIIIPDNAMLNLSTTIVFSDPTFRRCRFDRITWLVRKSEVPSFERGFEGPIPWLNPDARPNPS